MSQLQNENRPSLPFLFASFGEQVLAQLVEDETRDKIFSKEILEKIDRKKEDFSTQTEFMAEVVTPVMQAFLDKACPSAKSKPQIAKWVVKQYLSHRHNGKPVLAEDLSKIDVNLKYFNDLKKSDAFKETGASADLLSYKSYAAFEKMLEPHLKKREEQKALKTKFSMSAEEKAQIMAETTFLYKGPEGSVVVPHTPGASKYWGSHTKWCIAGQQNYSAEKMFPSYNASSPVIMILPAGQSDNKVALVNKLLYNSADRTIPSLPDVHRELMQKMLDNLSPAARKNLAPWTPEKIFIPATDETRQETGPEYAETPKRVRNEVNRAYETNEPDAALWNDRNFVLAAVKYSGMTLKFASDELKADPEVVLAAVKENGYAIEYAADEVKANREIIFVASKSGLSFRYAAPELRADRDFVLKVVAENGMGLWCLSDEFKADPEIVLAAVGSSPDMLDDAADELKNNREFVLSAIERNSFVLYEISEGFHADENPHWQQWSNDRAFVLEATSRNSDAFRHLSDKMKADPVVALAALRHDGSRLQFLPDFRDDKAMVLVAVNQSHFALRHASDRLRADPEVVRAAVAHDAMSIVYAADKFKQNGRFIKSLLESSEDLPFRIRSLEGLWQPDEAALEAYKQAALEKMAARGDMQKFIQHSRHMKSTWGDPEILFASDPAVMLEKTKAELLPEPRCVKPQAALAARAGI